MPISSFTVLKLIHYVSQPIVDTLEVQLFIYGVEKEPFLYFICEWVLETPIHDQ